jgi:hypothetical protein
MSNAEEINLGYVDHVRNLNHAGTGSASAAPQTASYPLKWRLRLAFNTFVSKVWWPAIRFFALMITALGLELWLRVFLFSKRTKPSQFTSLAVARVADFVEQYPFHLYPIVCKAFELACLETELPKLLNDGGRVLEVAIGDGTLSSRVFPADANVIGLDLSPYSLKKASEQPHVKQAIVCDCLNPPIREGSFDILLANNFLHHVTQKEQTLARWSWLAEKAVFNENSPTWASGWPVPYMLKKLGRPEEAARKAEDIERHSLQSLEPRTQLDAHVAGSYEVIRSDSYMSERTFFFCGVFSFLMGCYGPPTPAILKSLLLSKPLRWLTLPLSADIARLLIRYDQQQDRATDSFISYVCRSRNFVPAPAGNHLICANCNSELTQKNQCTGCGHTYSYTDGMLFLLPEKLSDLQREYNLEVSAQTPKEHL